MKKAFNWLAAYKNEILRVRWDSKEDIVKAFYVVISMLVIFALLFLGIDTLISQLFKVLGVNI